MAEDRPVELRARVQPPRALHLLLGLPRHERPQRQGVPPTIHPRVPWGPIRHREQQRGKERDRGQADALLLDRAVRGDCDAHFERQCHRYLHFFLCTY